MTTGDVRGSGTDANVFVILFGGKDGETNSGKLFLEDDSKNNFERGKTDIFCVECTEQFSPLHHLRIGHDNSGPSSGWYLEKVSCFSLSIASYVPLPLPLPQRIMAEGLKSKKFHFMHFTSF